MSLTIRLDPALDKRLGHAAVDEGLSKNALISEAVTAHLDAIEEPVMSDLTRALRKAEDAITEALVDEKVTGTPNPRLAGFRESAKHLIIMLRALAGTMESWENQEAVGGNVGHYASTVQDECEAWHD